MYNAYVMMLLAFPDGSICKIIGEVISLVRVLIRRGQHLIAESRGIPHIQYGCGERRRTDIVTARNSHLSYRILRSIRSKFHWMVTDLINDRMDTFDADKFLNTDAWGEKICDWTRRSFFLFLSSFVHACSLRLPAGSDRKWRPRRNRWVNVCLAYLSF